MKRYVYATLAGFVLGLLVAWLIFRQPPASPTTQVVYVDRKAPKRLRVPPVRPATRYLYLRRVDTIHVNVPVPVDLGRIRGVLPDGYVFRKRRALGLRYWSPDSLRYVEEVFRIPEPRWGIWIEGVSGYDHLNGFYAGGHLVIRRDRWVAFGGYTAATDGGRGVSFGLRRRIMGFY